MIFFSTFFFPLDSNTSSSPEQSDEFHRIGTSPDDVAAEFQNISGSTRPFSGFLRSPSSTQTQNQQHFQQLQNNRLSTQSPEPSILFEVIVNIDIEYVPGKEKERKKETNTETKINHR